MAPAEEKIGVLKGEKLTLLAELARTEADRQKLEAKHRELFTKQYPYIKKVADSYLLLMADLVQVSPDVPTPPPIATTSRYVVPTGRVNVPAGRYVVPTGKDNVIVSLGRAKVIPTGRTILVL
ncbi:hypothetical protein Tco_1396349, partial [Tanacetum coccineum]